jgi:transposase
MKEDGRKLSKEQQVEARRRAMLLVKKGWREHDIAEAVGVHPRTVQQWKQHQREHGTAALLCDERGRKHGDKRLMSAKQEKEVRRLITDKLPEQLKLPFALWTRKAVAQLLDKRFGLKLPVRTMGLYLKRWGLLRCAHPCGAACGWLSRSARLTPQKPLKKAYEQRPKEVQAWLEQKYPQIAAQAKAEGAEIYWGDQTGVNNQPNAVRGYAPRGETPEIKQMSKRFGSSMMSAVSNRGSSRWMVYKGALDARLLIRFLERLVRSMQGRKVYLILDNLRVHHSKPVKQWLEQHQEQIAVHHLPSYSPELNPDERLNRALKSKLGVLPAARSERELQKQIIGQMRSCQRQPEQVRAFFKSALTQYAA